MIPRYDDDRPAPPHAVPCHFSIGGVIFTMYGLDMISLVHFVGFNCSFPGFDLFHSPKNQEKENLQMLLLHLYLNEKLILIQFNLISIDLICLNSPCIVKITPPIEK